MTTTKTYYVCSGRLVKDDAQYLHHMLTKTFPKINFKLNRSVSYHYTVSARVPSTTSLEETRSQFKNCCQYLLSNYHDIIKGE